MTNDDTRMSRWVTIDHPLSGDEMAELASLADLSDSAFLARIMALRTERDALLAYARAVEHVAIRGAQAGEFTRLRAEHGVAHFFDQNEG